MKPISTPHDGRRWWDSNLRTSACESPALPLCYRRRHLLAYEPKCFPGASYPAVKLFIRMTPTAGLAEMLTGE